MSDIFPREIDYILSDYSIEKDNEMNQVAKESIKSEFDDKLDEMGVDLSYDMDEATITLADLFSESLQLNLFNSSAQEMVTKIISNKLGSNVGGWYENNYEYRDDSKFDKESFNRTVENQFEKIIEKMDEDSDSEYTIKDYIEFRARVLNKFKMKTWYETPKDKDIIFAVQDFDPTKMTVQLRVKDRETQSLKDIAMDEENFTQFLYQPSLFKLEDMY
jgi:translation initiation factor IF-1